MTTDTDLTNRINAEFSAAEKRWDQLRAIQLEAYRTRTERLERFEQIVDALRELWEPRLQALAKRFGKNMDAHLTEELGRRCASLEFGSKVARIILRFAVSPNADVTKLVVTYDVEILPVLMKFDSHKELELPLNAIDNTQLAKWIDDRIVSFVHVYLAIHENEYCRWSKIRLPRCDSPSSPRLQSSNGAVRLFISLTNQHSANFRSIATSVSPEVSRTAVTADSAMAGQAAASRLQRTS